jgi:hypothetical protein
VIDMNVFPGLVSGNNSEFYRLLGTALTASPPTAETPEPSSLILILIGIVFTIGGISLKNRRRR